MDSGSAVLRKPAWFWNAGRSIFRISTRSILSIRVLRTSIPPTTIIGCTLVKFYIAGTVARHEFLGSRSELLLGEGLRAAHPRSALSRGKGERSECCLTPPVHSLWHSLRDPWLPFVVKKESLIANFFSILKTQNTPRKFFGWGAWQPGTRF